MEAMAQASEDAREVQEAINVGGDVALGVGEVDDADLERELVLLVGEIAQEQEHERIERLAGVAATPAGAPVLEPSNEVGGLEKVSAPVHV